MSAPIISIRAATAEDAPRIAELLYQLNLLEGRDERIDASKLAVALAERKLCALLADASGIVVGAALYYDGYDVLTTAYGYHLADFVVDDAYRRRSIGTQLFTALAKQNLAQGGEWISLTVLRENKAAQAFYRALGMAQVPVEFYAAGKVMLQTATLLQK